MLYPFTSTTKINWSRVLPRLGFWLFITLLFLYERRYLIQKAGLPNFAACVAFRLAMLLALVYINLNVLIPRFFKPGRYPLFAGLLSISLIFYVGLQSVYDMYLFGFVIGDEKHTRFWYNIPYNLAASAWYLLITISFKISLDWLQQKSAVQQIAATEIAPSATIEHLYFKTGNKTIKTQVDDIVYVEALKDYSIIYTSNDKIVTKGTLKYMEEILPTDGFLRVHKSYIIAKNKIIAVERTRVILTPQIAIPVGKTFQEKLKSYTRPGAK